MPGALAAPPRDCDFCDWVDITHEPVLFLAGGGGDGTASLLQTIPSQLQVTSVGGCKRTLIVNFADMSTESMTLYHLWRGEGVTCHGHDVLWCRCAVGWGGATGLWLRRL